MWKTAEEIGSKEGRLDICIASAGLHGNGAPTLECSDADYQKVCSPPSFFLCQ